MHIKLLLAFVGFALLAAVYAENPMWTVIKLKNKTKAKYCAHVSANAKPECEKNLDSVVDSILADVSLLSPKAIEHMMAML
jgi:hypothetical protein